MPAVSIKIKSSPLTVNGILIESIVVPAISETINLSSFMKLLIKVDLPALGGSTSPTAAINFNLSQIDFSMPGHPA